MVDRRPFATAGFPPVLSQPTRYAGGVPVFPVYEREPRQSYLRLRQTSGDEPDAVLAVSEPTVVKAIRAGWMDDSAPPQRGELAIQWGPYPYSDSATSTAPWARNRVEFFGPYAYLPGPGLYFVRFSTLSSVGGLEPSYEVEVRTGVTPAEWGGLLCQTAPSFVVTQAHDIPAGGGLAWAMHYPSAWPLLRSVRMTNVGANGATLVLGAFYQELFQVNEVIELGPDLLGGRLTLGAISMMGTTIRTVETYF